jgi:putative hydrolase of the HAD superfamily
LQDLGLTVDDVVMVGDSFESDVMGANRMGIRAIWLNERSAELRTGEMYRTIRNLSELPQVLEEFVL